MRIKWLMSAALTTVCLVGGSVSAANLTLLSSWDNSYNAVPIFVDSYIAKVKEKSKDNIKIDVRGPETVPPFEQLQPVSSGLFDLLFTHGAYHLGETSMAFGLDATKDDPKLRRTSGIYELIDDHYAKHNLKLLGVFSSASGYHVLLRDPIGSDGALRGRKIRASSTYHDMIESLNGAVVTLPASEIYSSLERNVVDGAAWPVFGALEYGWNEVANYMTRPTFGVTNQSLFINLDKWESLSSEEQEVLQSAAIELETEGRQVFADLWSKEDAEMQKAGLEITEFGPDIAPKVNALFEQGVWKQVRNRAGQDGEGFYKLAIEKGLTEEP